VVRGAPCFGNRPIKPIKKGAVVRQQEKYAGGQFGAQHRALAKKVGTKAQDGGCWNSKIKREQKQTGRGGGRTEKAKGFVQ